MIPYKVMMYFPLNVVARSTSRLARSSALQAPLLRSQARARVVKPQALRLRSIAGCATPPAAPLFRAAVATAAAAAAVASATVPTVGQCSASFDASDAFYADGDFESEADALERNYSDAEKLTVEWIWRRARSKYQIASLKATPGKEKQALINEAYEMIQQASIKDDSVPGVLLWHGVILSEWSSLQGTKVKIAHLLDVKHLWERAVELHPSDASSLHFLGRWEHGITEIDWFSRNAANLIFGSLPPASYESALAYFMRAEEINPGFWKRNLVFIAQCEIKLGNAQKAKETLLRARQIHDKTEEDMESSRIIEKFMKQQRWE